MKLFKATFQVRVRSIIYRQGCLGDSYKNHLSPVLCCLLWDYRDDDDRPTQREC